MLSWAEAEGAAVIPFGGGTSVVGGVEPRLGERPVVTMDLRRLDRVLEVDPTSLAARIQAGATGPRLEEQLREHGLTLRHFPQSFEYATLGGWIATRAGGHFATARDPHRRPGRVGAGDHPARDLGEPAAAGLRRRSLARPDADRLRGDPRRRSPRPGCGCGRGPSSRPRAGVEFDDFLAAARAVREIAQSGLHPANCRLLDAAEAELTGAGDGERQPPDPRLRVRPPPGRRADATWRSRSPASTAARRRRGPHGPMSEPQRGRAARTRSGPGAAPSCWRPTCATPSSPAACSRRPSRRRSPGTASRSSTRR